MITRLDNFFNLLLP